MTRLHSDHRAREPAAGKRLALGVAVALAVLATVLPLGTAAAGAQPTRDIEITRIQGHNRYVTSVAVARQFLEDVGGSIDAAVFVSGESWHDAVVAPGLAGKLNAPVLLTPPDRLLSDAAEFLAEAGVTKTVVIGAPDVVSHEVLGRLARFGSVERIWRSSPEATSVAVAKRMGTPGELEPGRNTAFLTTSEKFAPALIVGPPSFRGGHPVLLTPSDSLHKSMESYLATSDVETLFVPGGPAALSWKVWGEVKAVGKGLRGTSNEDRTGTSAIVAGSLENQYADWPEPDRCFDSSAYGLASAWNPIHALSSGPLLGNRCAALLLTDSGRLSPSLEWTINHRARSLVVFGGETAVSSRALGQFVEGAELQGVFDHAASQRDWIVGKLRRRINAGAYGVDDNMFHGPAGFEIDVDECPEGWSDTAGITDNEIRIGLTIPKSGQYVTYGNIEWGLAVYFDWVNRNDAVAGRKIRLVSKDDSYDPRRTAAQIDSLIETENVFSVLTLGTPTTLAAYDRINEACVPHPFVMSGHPAWGDPVNHPWTTGMQMSYSTEAILWGRWIEQRFGSRLPVTVGALVSDDDLGAAYQNAFADWARAHPDVISGLLAVRHDPAALVFDDEAATIGEYEPDVYISMTSGNPCWRAMQSLGWMGVADDIRSRNGFLIMSSVCANPQTVHLAGRSSDGWYSVRGGLKAANDPTHANDVFIEFVNESIDESRHDPDQPLYGMAYWFAYPYVEALRIAAELPGGLTRTNLMLTVRSLNISHPMLADGIRLRTNGNEDAIAIEASEFSRYNAEIGAWRVLGPVIDVEGTTQNCAWNPDDGTCE